MISFLFEICGFTNNPNFIPFKWRLKRKHSPVKCVIRATEIRRMEIRLKDGEHEGLLKRIKRIFLKLHDFIARSVDFKRGDYKPC